MQNHSTLTGWQELFFLIQILASNLSAAVAIAAFQIYG